jgi:SPRY domain
MTGTQMCRYEVALQTSGIQQLGWATLRCQFTQEEGVGDTPDSYAYDGKRCRKWHVRSGDYGDIWNAGDVVSVCLDLDACMVRDSADLHRAPVNQRLCLYLANGAT